MDAPFDPVATGRDASRLVPTSTDTDYTLSLEEVSESYARAGHSRTLRSLQRYCVSGHLDAQKIATTTGDKYLVTSQSVARHIAQIEELSALENVATGRDTSRHVATPVAAQQSVVRHDEARQEATGDDTNREVALENPMNQRYVEQLEKRIEEKDDVIGLLKGQLIAKDEQIGELSTRYRETHSLLGAMQRMFAPLLGQGDPYKVSPSERAVQGSEASAHEDQPRAN